MLVQRTTVWRDYNVTAGQKTSHALNRGKPGARFG